MESTLFIIWTVVGTASLTLGAVHGVLWVMDRRRLANLAFCVTASSIAAIARIEYGMMRAATPQEYGEWLRWIHLSIFVLYIGLVFFVRFHFGTARGWLGWTMIALRGVVTAANQFGPAGASWKVIRVDQVPFLSELASAGGAATIRPLQWLATATALLMIVYVLDAAVALWRKRDAEARRRAVIVGGGIAGFVLVTTVASQLVIWGLVRMPIMLSPPFLIMLAVMAYELCRDIVAATRIEGEARRLRDELAHVSRVSTLSELSGSLAHELNQPLGAILRNAEAAQLLLEGPAPDLEELRAIIVDIHADDRRAGGIIEHMRGLLKRHSLELQAVSLDALVLEVLALVRADAAARRVTLDYSIPEGLPPVAGDRVQVSQVLLNLLVNGMDAVSESPGRTRRVAIEARRANDRTVEIAVADSGPGISSDLLPKVFEPFVTTKAKGMGIGLAVSRTIVEAHGGQLSASNNPAGGATFRFTLPIAHGGR